MEKFAEPLQIDFTQCDEKHGSINRADLFLEFRGERFSLRTLSLIPPFLRPSPLAVYPGAARHQPLPTPASFGFLGTVGFSVLRFPF